LCEPTDALWLEVKVAYQFREGGVRHTRYGAQWRQAVVDDLRKIEAEPLIRHAGLVLVVFNESQDVWRRISSCSRTCWRGRKCSPGSARSAALRSSSASATACAPWPFGRPCSVRTAAQRLCPLSGGCGTLLALLHLNTTNRPPLWRVAGSAVLPDRFGRATKENAMSTLLMLGIVFLIIAVLAYALGARGVAGMSAGVGRTLLFVFLVLAVIFAVVGLVQGA
jgi:uncharacterized membrane protein YtjA (UPF0391 family)